MAAKTKAPRRRERTSPEMLAALAALPELPPGRTYLCLAPHCWGKDRSPQAAEANARKHRVRNYEPPTGWGWILYDVPADATVNGAGYLVRGADTEPAREVLRFNVPQEQN